MEAVRRLRREAGLTQEQLARLAGVNKVTLVHVERGTTNPKVETLERLADALGVEVASFFPKGEAPSAFEARQHSEKTPVRLGDVAGPQRLSHVHGEINRLFDQRRAGEISAADYLEAMTSVLNSLMDQAERASREAV